MANHPETCRCDECDRTPVCACGVCGQPMTPEFVIAAVMHYGEMTPRYIGVHPGECARKAVGVLAVSNG
jgi:hypothetical protein